MTEPPRPPGEGNPFDPTTPFPTPGSAPPGHPHSEDRTAILLAHFGGAAGALFGIGLAGWIVPMIVLIAQGNRSAAVRAEALKALNFQIVCSAVALVGCILLCIGIGQVVIAIATIAAVSLGVVAGVQTHKGEPYQYPLAYPIIK